MTPLEAKEMSPYIDAADAAPVGLAGKTGYLRMGFELDAEGRSVMRDLERRVPFIVQQELYFDECMPEMPCVYILSSGGQNVDGDRYEQNITVRRGAFAHVSTGAATKLASMRRDYSSLVQRFSLEDDAYLEYLPEPVIPCRNTRFWSDTALAVAPTATLFYSEIYMSGRRYYGLGERFAYDILSVCTHAERPDGEELFRRKFTVRPADRSPETAGAMNGYDVFADVAVLTPRRHADALLQRTEAYIDRERRIAAGIARLPFDCGLSFTVLGDETEEVKRVVRSFCSEVRRQVKGKPLFDEFPWR